MSLINKLQNNGSVLSANNGVTPSIPDFDLSKLHDTYSLNGDPNLVSKPAPTQLSNDGEQPKYLDNLPQ